MTDEELNRKFDIVAGHLATLAVTQQKAEERMNRMDDGIMRLRRTLLTAIRAGRRERREWRERHAALIDAQVRSEDKLVRLEEAQSRTDESLRQLAESQKRTEESLKQLSDSQAHTDKRLDALIDIVREERDGRARGEE